MVDLQENYRLAASVAPHVDKIRYNPGHLHHVERDKSIADKVGWLVAVARDTDTAIRIGVNCGSVAPEFLERYPGDQLEAIVQSALYHCQLMEELGFDRFVVSLKDSDPDKVVAANRRFAAARPDVPLHLGVTEAGLPPEGIIKTRLAFEKLLAAGIGDTLRVSLTLPNERKHEEVEVGFAIIDDVRARPLHLRAGLRQRPEHHLVPELLARRERELRPARRAGARPDRATRRRTASPSP